MKKMMTAVAVFALGTSLAFASPRGDWKGGRHGEAGMSEKLAQKLNLSDAQKAEIKAIEQQFRTDNAAFFQTARQTREDFRAAKQANDQARVDALKATMESQRAQMKQLRDAQREKIRNILTPDQRAQFDAMKAKHQSRREQK